MLSQQHHTVVAKETLYGLSKKYNVSIEDLKKANPQLNNRALQIGDILVIPDKSTPSNLNRISEYDSSINLQRKQNEENSEYIFITVEPKQTLYGLSKKYNTTIKAIKSLNPSLDKNGPKIGEVLKIPNNSKVQDKITYSHVYNQNDQNTHIEPKNVNSESKDEKVGANNLNQTETRVNSGEEKEPINLNNNKSETVSDLEFKKEGVNIVMFLPFHTGETSNNAEKRIATQFYSGVKLAMDSLSNKGKKIHVKIFDSSKNKEYQEIINTYNFSNTNLIIGPSFKSDLLALTEKIKKVPIISPFSSSDDLDDYENLILYNTKDQILVEKIVDEMMKKYADEKVYILYDDDHYKAAMYFQSLVKEKSSNAEIVLTKNAEDIIPDRNLVTNEYNKIYAILFSNQEPIVNKYLDTIVMYQSNQVNPISLFYSSLFDNSKYEEKLLDLGLLYLDTNYVNEYGFNEQKMLKMYAKEYCHMPDKYAIAGFDVTYDILSRVDEKGNLSNSIMKVETKQVSNKYSFRRIKKNGAWVNQEARLIKLLK